ncbi:MAG: LapA family protein [Gammaproteobacteria bacterium]|nr:LapA family protein [Gammaproteobacteria bacterium]
MRFLKLLLFLLVMLVGAAFAVMNAEQVHLDYYFGAAEIPLSVILLGALCAGAFLGIMASLSVLAGLKRENAALRRKAQLASQEVSNLRALPIKEN